MEYFFTKVINKKNMSLIFKIGMTVKLKHTFDIGEIKEIYEDGMLSVLLEGEDAPIPISEENVLDPNMFSTPIPKKERKYSTHIPYEFYGFENYFLHAVPVVSEQGPTYFDLYFANISNQKLVAQCMFTVGQIIEFKGISTFEKYAFNYICSFKSDDLSSSVHFSADIRPITNQGTGKSMNFDFNIKTSRFFKNFNKYYPLPIEGYSIDISPTKPAEKENDLKSYSIQKQYENENLKKVQAKEKEKKIAVNNYISKRYAEFSTELDLHIENLTDKYSTLNGSQKLKLQLNAFENYLNEAIQINIDRVFIIHGIGSGKLKNEIATILIRNPHVKTFINEWHPKYGFGATEVVLK